MVNSVPFGLYCVVMAMENSEKCCYEDMRQATAASGGTSEKLDIALVQSLLQYGMGMHGGFALFYQV